MVACFFLFLLGLCFGSFINVVVYREIKGESWWKGRSYCDFCKKKLSWRDNLPLFSFLLLKGFCRYCHKRIPLQYPLVEFFTGLSFVLIYYFFPFKPLNLLNLLNLFIYLGLALAGITIFVADWRYQIIPDSAIFLGFFLTILKLMAGFFYNHLSPTPFLLSGLIAGLFFLLLFFITKGKGMGFGDVKLAFLMGLFLGFPKILMALFLAFLTGAMVGVILILQKKKKLKSQIAFGPFLILGTVLAIAFGERLWEFLIF